MIFKRKGKTYEYKNGKVTEKRIQNGKSTDLPNPLPFLYSLSTSKNIKLKMRERAKERRKNMVSSILEHTT